MNNLIDKNTTMPDISIIIPVYNVEEYLLKCYESIKMQSINNIEIIFIDDGSRDSSGRICNNLYLQDNRVKVIHKNNEGALIARKVGIENSTGEYIYFIDPDDYLTDEKSLEIMLNEIRKENVDILHFDVAVDGDDKKEVSDKLKYLSIQERKYDSAYSIIKNAILRTYTWHLWNKIFKGDVCRMAVKGVKNVKMYTATDAYMYLVFAYYAKTYKSIHTNALYTYRIGQGVTTHKEISLEDFNKYIYETNIISYLAEFYIQEKCLGVYIDLLGDLENRFFNHCYWRYTQLSKDLKTEAKDVLINTFGSEKFNARVSGENQKKRPKVSIIVPTYNVSKYLNECMDSILNQTLKDIEVIAIDDGSTDESLKILREYENKDKRVKVITKPNSGYGHTMNIGLDRASGEYIGIVEPDDWVRPKMYETLYDLAKRKNLDIIKADFNRFVGSGKSRIDTLNKLSGKDEDYNVVFKPADRLDSFKYVMNTWSGIYRTDFIKRNKIRHNETPGASFQDNGFWFQTFCLADRVMLNKNAFYMNRRDNVNSSVKSKGKVYAFKHEYDFIYDFVKKTNNKSFYRVWLYMKYRNYLSNYNRIDESFHKEFLIEFKNAFKDVKDEELSYFREPEKKLLRIILNSDVDAFCHCFKQYTWPEIDKYKNLPIDVVSMIKYTRFLSKKSNYIYKIRKAISSAFKK